MELVDLLAAVLRGDALAASSFVRFDPETICAEANHHGILPLLALRVAGRGDVAPPLRMLLRERAAAAASADLLREVELKQALDAFAAHGIDALVFKGGHVAYVYYARPDLRPRIDTDLLIREPQRMAAQTLLAALGYEPVTKVTGELVTGQSGHVKRRHGAVAHEIDLHWRVVTPAVFTGVLSYEELAARAAPIPALGAHAFGPGDADALFIACVHRVAHHDDAVVLNWLYDIDLICRRMAPAEWERYVALAVERCVAAVCRRSLERTVEWFHTPIPPSAMAALRDGKSGELSAGYLKPRSQAAAVMDDLRALPKWRDRVRLVHEHLFPAPAYMRQAYPAAARVPVPALYAWRFLRGARRWLTR